ncbi:MAG: hypothetical protein ACLQD8_00430 [Thermoplasmata archaeon]
MATTPSPPQERYRTLRLCSGGGGFEAIPRRPARIDLVRLRTRLTAAGIGAVDARVMLIAAFEAEVTISVGGRILIKTSEAALAEQLFDRVLSLLADGSAGEPSPEAGRRSV